MKIIEGYDKQTTIKSEFEIAGPSAYINKICTVKFRPAKANTGIIFVKDGFEVKALIENIDVNSYEHTTVLKTTETEIRTIEHILSAVWGMGIDNLYIELLDGEIPFISSSSLEYAQKIEEVGLIELEANRKYIVFQEIFRLKESNGNQGYIVIKPSLENTISAILDFENLLGYQKILIKNTPNDYVQQIAPARSFMRSALDENNEKWNYLRRLFPAIPEDKEESPIIIFNEKSYITPLRIEQEPVRHKILDYFGDIALLGIRIKGEVNLYKPGHKFTHEIVREVKNLHNHEKI